MSTANFAHRGFCPKVLTLKAVLMRGRSMKPGLRIDLSICTAGCTAERIEQNPQDESLYRRLMGGNVRWASRRWRTKSFSRPW